MKTLENYGALKSRQSTEFNEFEGIFYAFSNKQFNEGMEKIGLNTDNDLKKIVSLGHGGYMLKSRKEEFKALVNRHDKELKELKKEEKSLVNAIAYELRNHEYCITHDPKDALNVLGLTDIDPKILKKACSLALKK